MLVGVTVQLPHPRVLGEPADDLWGLVRQGAVVEHQVRGEMGGGQFDVERLSRNFCDHSIATVTLVQGAVSPSPVERWGDRVEDSKCRGACQSRVARIGGPGQRLRRGSVERCDRTPSNLRFLVGGDEDHVIAVRRVEIQAADVIDLLDATDVNGGPSLIFDRGGEVAAPNACHVRRTESAVTPRLRGHRPRGPVRRVLRCAARASMVAI